MLQFNLVMKQTTKKINKLTIFHQEIIQSQIMKVLNNNINKNNNNIN